METEPWHLEVLPKDESGFWDREILGRVIELDNESTCDDKGVVQPWYYPLDLEEYGEMATYPISGVIVAKTGDAFIGFIAFRVETVSDRREMFFHKLAVRRDYRRKGVSFDLAKKAHDLGKEYNVDSFRLTCCDANTPALLLYKALGFKVVSQEQTTLTMRCLIGEANFSK